jgi:hypothetical protein
MPDFFHAFSLLYPIRHYFLNYTNIAIYGNGFAACWPQFAMLAAFGLLPVVGAVVLKKNYLIVSE